MWNFVIVAEETERAKPRMALRVSDQKWYVYLLLTFPWPMHVA